MNIKPKLVSIALTGTLAFTLSTGAAAAGNFTDVQSSDWYYNAVNHVVERNYFNGVSANTFAPNGSMNRAMAVTVLARMFGGDLKGYTGKTPFTDVPIDGYYAKAVQWAVDKGITNGSDGLLKPKASTTRAAFATITMNYDNLAGGSVTPAPDPTPTPTPDPTPDPTPAPDPTPSDEAAAKENQVNDLLVASWGAEAPTRDTGKLAEAARLIASGSTKDVEEALKSVGFDKPVGTIYRDKYVYDRYEVKSFLVTSSSVTQAVNNLKKNDALMKTDSYTNYGIGVYQMNAIQFRVSVVTYDSDCYSNADTTQMMTDWLAEQATLPVSLTDMEQQVLDLTNQERAKYGLEPLKVATETQEVAHLRATELQTLINSQHTRPDGRMYYTVLNDIDSVLSYEINGDARNAGNTGENIASGPTTPAEVVNAWMNSFSHRSSILSSRYTHIGIGIAPRYINGVQSGYYWEQFFLGVNP